MASVVVLGLYVATAPEQSFAQSRAACSAPGSRTVTEVRQVRVFRKGRVSYACHRRVNRPFALGRRTDDLGFLGARNFAVAGPYVGYSLAYSSRDDEYARVRVIDARSGRVRRSVLQRLGRFKIAEVRDLEVTRTGAVAWIALEGTGCGRVCQTLTCSVRSADERRRFGAAVLDMGGCFGDGIEPESLSRQGSTLTWSKLGQPVSAILR